MIPRYISGRPNVNRFVAFDIRVCRMAIVGAILRVNWIYANETQNTVNARRNFNVAIYGTVYVTTRGDNHYDDATRVILIFISPPGWDTRVSGDAN